MILLVGLGNPGSEYENNRHNVGYMVIDAIHARYGFPSFRRKFQGLFSEGSIAGHKVWLLKPTTYMNESGRSVLAVRKFFEVKREETIVFHDEIDLESGKIRAKNGGGYAGHNGLKSIGNMIGPDFRRIRIGVGHPGNKQQVKGHVLRNFSKEDRKWLEKSVDALAEAVPLLIDGDDAGYMTKVSLILKPPVHKPRPSDRSADDNKT